MISKVFKKLVNRIVDHQEKCSLFSDFQYSFRSSRSTADLLTVVSDRIARAFNRSGAARAGGLIHKLKSCGISGQMFGLISSFLSNYWLHVVLDENIHKNIPLILEFVRGLFLALHFSYYTLTTFICNITIYADDTTFYFKCDQHVICDNI